MLENFIKKKAQIIFLKKKLTLKFFFNFKM